MDAAVPVTRDAKAQLHDTCPIRAHSPSPNSSAPVLFNPLVQGLAATAPAKFAEFGQALRAGEACVAVLVPVGHENCGICDWISDWVDHPHFVTAQSHATDSRRSKPDVLLVCGANPASLAKALAACRTDWPATAIVAVTESAVPIDRAQMLRIGADDVFDLTMPTPEAAARVRAVHLRSLFYRQTK